MVEDNTIIKNKTNSGGSNSNSNSSSSSISSNNSSNNSSSNSSSNIAHTQPQKKGLFYIPTSTTPIPKISTNSGNRSSSSSNSNSNIQHQQHQQYNGQGGMDRVRSPSRGNSQSQLIANQIMLHSNGGSFTIGGSGCGSGSGSSTPSKTHTPNMINSTSNSSLFSMQSLASLSSFQNLSLDSTTSKSSSNIKDGNQISSGVVSRNLQKEFGLNTDDHSDLECLTETNRSNSSDSQFSIVSSCKSDTEVEGHEDIVDHENVSNEIKNKYIIILTGLPASGKSTLCKSLIDYLHQNKNKNENNENNNDNNNDSNEKDLIIEIFNAGKIRRSDSIDKFNTMLKLSNNSNEDLFNPKNSQKKEIYAKLALDKLFFNISKLDIAIFDATNSTPNRRLFLINQINKHILKKNFSNSNSKENYIPIFLQIKCNNKNFIKYNIYNKTKNDDYFDKPYIYALKDFAKRLKYYKQQYIAMDDQEMNYLSNQMNTLEEEDDNDEQSNHSNRKKLYFISITNGDKNYHIYDENSDEKDEIIILIEKFVKNFYTSTINKSYTHRVDEFFQDKDGANRKSIDDLNNILHDV